MSNAPFKTDPVRTAIALAYRNEQFIADMILPRMRVGEEEFTWISYNKEDRFTIPNTLVDRKGKLNQVEFGGTEKTAMTNDYGLEDVVPVKDVKAGNKVGFDALGNASELTLELILLEREQRVANLINNAATYPTDNKETLGASDRWDADTGNPITQLSDALETPLMRPNILVLSSAGALALRRNKAVVKAYHGNTGDDGLVPLEWIRQLFELDAIYVGRARYNASNPGQTMSLTRLWGNSATLLYRNPSAALKRGVTFGLTAEHESRIVRTKFDDDVGLRGAHRVQVGESVKEVIMASDVAYHFATITG